MAGPQVSIAIVANERPAVAAFANTGSAVETMGRKVDHAGKDVDHLGEKFGDANSKSSQLAGALGDVAGAFANTGDKAGILGKSVGNVAGTVEGLAPFVMVAAGAFDILELALNATALASARNAAAAVGSKVAMVASTVATYALAAAQTALDVALDANPIGVVVLAIAALVGVFILAYKKSETFRDILSSTWTTIKDATVAVFTFIPKFISDAIDWVKNKLLDLANYVLPDWLTKLLGISNSDTSIKVNATTSTTSAQTASFSAARDMARSNAGSAVYQTNNIHVPEGVTDPHAFGRKVAAGIRDQTRIGAI